MRISRVEGRRARRAAVIEESVLQRTRTSQLLAEERDLDVVLDCSTLRQFLSWLQRTDRTRWPHLLILGIPTDSDPVRDPEAIAALTDAGMRTLLLSALHPRSTAHRLVDAGVDGVVSTSDSEHEFLEIVDAVLDGEKRMTPRAGSILRGPHDAPRLSTQEERVLALYATGLTIAEVAVRIGVRHDTARKYLARVRDKFTAAGRPARSKLELARIAWAEGYVADGTVRPTALFSPAR